MPRAILGFNPARVVPEILLAFDYYLSTKNKNNVKYLTVLFFFLY